MVWDFFVDRHDVVRTYSLVAAGVVGIGLAVWRSLIAARQRDISQRQTDLNERGQATDRLTKAVEQISSDRLYERLGGIHALGQIAATARKGGELPDAARHREDLDAVRNVLCEFIRTPPYAEQQRLRQAEWERYLEARQDWEREKAGGPNPGPAPDSPSRIDCPDVAAAIKAMQACGRPTDDEGKEGRFKLEGANLSCLDLAGVDLSHSNLTVAQLGYAGFLGSCFHRAYLVGAHLDYALLYQANLRHANLTWANLLGASFPGADLSGADFMGAESLDPEGFRSTYYIQSPPSYLLDECLAEVQEWTSD